MKYFDENAIYYKIGKRTLKVSESHLCVVKVIHNGEYTDMKDIATISGKSTNTVGKIIKMYRLRDYYENNKTKTTGIRDIILDVMSTKTYKNFHDISTICGISTTYAREIIFSDETLSKLYFNNLSGNNPKYMKIINFVKTCTYGTQYDIAQMCKCSKSYVSQVINQFNLSSVYYKKIKGTI